MKNDKKQWNKQFVPRNAKYRVICVYDVNYYQLSVVPNKIHLDITLQRIRHILMFNVWIFTDEFIELWQTMSSKSMSLVLRG